MQLLLSYLLLMQLYYSMKKPFVKSINERLQLKAWTDLRIARKGIIAREVAPIIKDSAEQKILLFEKKAMLGFILKSFLKQDMGTIVLVKL